MTNYVNYKKDGIPMTPKNPHHKECVFTDGWSECHKECPVLLICAYYIPDEDKKVWKKYRHEWKSLTNVPNIGIWKPILVKGDDDIALRGDLQNGEITFEPSVISEEELARWTQIAWADRCDNEDCEDCEG